MASCGSVHPHLVSLENLRFLAVRAEGALQATQSRSGSGVHPCTPSMQSMQHGDKAVSRQPKDFNAYTGKIIDANPFIGELLGYSQVELLGQELWQVGLFKDIEASRVAIQELRERHYLRRSHLALKTKAGQQIAAEVASNLYW